MFLFSSQESAAPKRSSLGRLVDQSTLLLMFCIGALIFVLALLILFHENANATKGYRLRTLEQERSQLLLEQEIVNMEVAQAQSLQSLESDKFVQAMVDVRSPQYIDQDHSVAFRE